jgi:predicted PurR-regulated permease PerM
MTGATLPTRLDGFPPETDMTELLPQNPIARWLLAFLLLAGVYFFHGFLIPVLAALVIGLASWPLYRRLVIWCRGNTAIAATIALCVILVGLVVPLTMILISAADEIRSWIYWLQEANKQGIPAPEWVSALPMFGERLAESWDDYLAAPHALGEVIQFLSGEHIGNISRWALAAGGGALSFLLTMLFILITLFFIYKDGSALMAQVDKVGERILPERWQRFSRVVPATVSATVTGMGLIAIGEGVILGVAYKLAGVPSSFALGVLTGFMALIPGGAPLAFTLVSIFLVVTGSVVPGIALFAWGSLELFIVDKTIRPRLVGGPIRLPFLPTFFGLIGGAKTMGLVGLFVGPVLMALLVAVWREWLRTSEPVPAPPVSSEPIPVPTTPQILP